MSRLESESSPRFEIEKEQVPMGQGLISLPLHLRKHAVEQFDGEFKIADIKASESKLTLESTVNPEVAELLINARALFEKGEVQLAQDLYESVLKSNPVQELAIRGVAECEKFFFQHDKALLKLKSLVLHHSTGANFKLLGDQLYAMGYLEDAVEAYLRSLQKMDLHEAEQFVVYKNLGNIFLKLGEVDGAEEFYNKAYTIDPDSDTLFVNYGSLYVYRGDYNKALERFRQAIALNDKNDKAWVGLAMIHREFGDLELAWANVEKALDISPGNESAIKLVCDWAMKDNEIDKANRRISAYVPLHTDDAVVLMWYAKFLYFSGQLELAKKQIEQALKINPHLEGGYDVLAVIQSEMAAKGLF